MTLRSTKRGAMLTALLTGPKTGAELADVVDDITPCIARTMAHLADRGLCVNQRRGLGGKAIYAITDAGRNAVAKTEEAQL